MANMQWNVLWWMLRDIAHVDLLQSEADHSFHWKSSELIRIPKWACSKQKVEWCYLSRRRGLEHELRVFLALVLHELGLAGVLLVTPLAALGVRCDTPHCLRVGGVRQSRYLRHTSLHAQAHCVLQSTLSDGTSSPNSTKKVIVLIRRVCGRSEQH